MLTIAGLTFREVLRKKFLFLTLVLTLAFFVLFGTGVYHANKNIGADAQMVRAVVIPQLYFLGLYFGNFIIAFLAIFSSVGAISSEIENGTMHAIISRPVRRSEIVLGKFLGFGVMLLFWAALFFEAVTLLVSIITGISVPLGYQIGALTLFCFQPLVLLAVAILGTTFLPTLANGVALFALYAVGVIGGMIEQIGWMAKSDTLVNVGIISSLVVPTDALYRKLTHIIAAATNSPLNLMQMGPFGSQAEPSGLMLGYSVIYLLGALVLAITIFNRRDI